MTIAARLQYKVDTLLLSLAVFVRESVTVVTLWFMLNKVSTINGWDMGQLLFMYSFVFLTYSLCILIFTGVRDFESIANQGEFDTYLTKPLRPLFQVIARRSDVMATIGHGGLGVVLIVYAASRSGITFDWAHIGILITMIVGGVLIQGGILLFVASLTFWTTKSSEIQNLLFYQMRGFIAYPISIYPTLIRYLLTYILPFAFVSFYPAQYFYSVQMSAVGLLTPLVGILVFGFALAIWKIGIRRYASTGH
ncbi:ABC transporter permease [Paenibacillus sp. NEAU-GSW1]|uniref:ABC transporter permease n=1 Tax=Paenibacillus sp. NEAU-GSW1 TaxID=2682486 RepID=UPI0015679C69|nr:ABC-2 family transporter protein [Paenibacillus sp. NEAU-GSW1]